MIRAVGVETGGSNVQFAVNPETDEIVVIEMNPRVSRSSALASKATGFPIAKIAARLAVGYTLDEIPNDITRRTPASFEPTIDYVVVKWPRFAFEKFPGVDDELTTHMKSVGEVMAIGRTFQQAFAKAMRSRELDSPVDGDDDLAGAARAPGRRPLRPRCWRRSAAARPCEEVHARTAIDPWFLRELARAGAPTRSAPFRGERTLQGRRHLRRRVRGRDAVLLLGLGAPARPHEVRRGDKPSVMILGSGPNRIGQGIEFDYCCVHAAMTVRESGRDAVMVNCNPETVSTDYDTSDRLYFEPLTLEDVLGDRRRSSEPEGVIVQFGGQTPLQARRRAGGGRRAAARHARRRRSTWPRTAGASARCSTGSATRRPPYATAHSAEEALAVAPRVGFPLLVRPSYVLGGRAMEIVYDAAGLERLPARVARVLADGREIFLDRFLEDAIEVDVDALCDGEDVWIGGVMQHVEEAGIHSGDSACVLPPHSLGARDARARSREPTRRLALGARRRRAAQRPVRGARRRPLRDRGQPARLAHRAVRLQGDRRAAGQARLPDDARRAARRRSTCPAEPGGRPRGVKEAVLPFDRFPGSDALLGPEMRSTGEVMGIAPRLPDRVRQGAGRGGRAAAAGRAPCSSRSPTPTRPARPASRRSCTTSASRSSPRAARRRRSRAWASRSSALNKIGEGSPHVVDWIERGDVDLVINTPTGTAARADGYEIRARRRRARHPVHHDALGRDGRRAGDRRRRATGDPPVLSLQELPPPRGSAARAAAAVSAHARAASAAGSCRGRLRTARSAPTACSRCADPDGPAPRPGPVLHARRERALGRGRRTSARSCRARSRSCAPGDGAARVPARGRRPGHAPAGRAARRRRAVAARSARAIGFAPPRGRARGRCSSAAASGSRRWRSGRTSSARSGACSGFRDRGARRGARRLLPRRAASRPTTARSATTASSPTCSPRSSSDPRAAVYACGPPPMLEAVRALCAARGVPAQLALESGMACGFGACFGCVVPTRDGYVRLCVDGPVLDAGDLETALSRGGGA